MTVATTRREAASLTNGVTTAFPVIFKVMLPGDLTVSLETIGTDRVQVLTEGVDYSITGDLRAGLGTVTTAVAYPAGYRLRRRRTTARTQGLDLVPNDGAPADSQEDAFDRAILITQELDDDVAALTLRALRVPIGETVTVLPAAATRALKLLGFDAAGQPVTVPGYAGGIPGPPGPIDTHSESTLAVMANLSRAVRERAYTTTPIKFAAIGSSNGLNENGGLAGVGNSPVEVGMRAIQAKLDPNNTCIWECANFSENGTGYSGWNTAINNPKSPREYLEEYDPDVLIICYGTNDYAPENFNVGETRGLIPIFMAEIYEWCDKHNCDAINIIPPMPHVGKTKQTREDPVSGLLVQGRALNYTVPTSYPTRSFQRGQQNDQAPGGDLLVSFVDGNTIAGEVGVFDDGSLYPGAVVWVANPDLLSPIVNGGYYTIGSISADKSRLVLSNVATVNAYDYVVGPAVNLTTTGPVRVTIWRVAIDPFTELTPSFTEAFGYIDVEGTPVEILTREQMVSQDIRQQTAVSTYNVALIDMMFDHVRAIVKYGEDRYYTQPVDPSQPVNAVHWNSICVAEIVEPAFEKFANSLIESPAGIVAKQPIYFPRFAVRPDGVPLLKAADLGINRTIDIQMAVGESIVLRAPSGAIHTEFTPQGGTIKHLGSAGLPFKRIPIDLVEANVSQIDGIVIPLPASTKLLGYIFGEQPGVGIQWRHISAFNSAGVITMKVSDEATSANDVFTITTQVNSIKISVLGANTQITTELVLSPFTYGEFEY